MCDVEKKIFDTKAGKPRAKVASLIIKRDDQLLVRFAVKYILILIKKYRRASFSRFRGWLNISIYINLNIR